MCNSRLRTDDLMDMITSIMQKKAKVQDNLRLQTLLKCTYKLLDHELRESQTSRKRKWLEIITNSKKSKSDPMYDSMDSDILATEMSLLSVLSILRSNNCV